MKIKRFAVLVLAVLAGCTAAPPTPPIPPTPPAAEGLVTTVHGRNVEDISRDVREWHDLAHADCKFIRVVGAQIISQQGNQATEHWTVEACGAKRFTYEVMIERGAHGISDAVGNVGALTRLVPR